MGWHGLALAGIYYFNLFVLFYFVALNTIYLVLFLLSVREVFKFIHRTFFSDYGQLMQSDMTWPISILVPAHNEEKTIVESVRSLQMLIFENMILYYLLSRTLSISLETMGCAANTSTWVLNPGSWSASKKDLNITWYLLADSRVNTLREFDS